MASDSKCCLSVKARLAGGITQACADLLARLPAHGKTALGFHFTQQPVNRPLRLSEIAAAENIVVIQDVIQVV